MRFASAIGAVALLVSALACKTEKYARDTQSSAGSTAASSTPAAAATATELSGETTITTTDGGVSMTLAHDTIAVRLSDRTLDKVKHDLDTTKARDDLGGFIERTVKSTVKNALSYRITVPVSDVKDARYEDGRIELDLAHEPRFDWTHIKTDDRPLMESFSPADAERFVQAVRKARGLH